MGCGANEKTGRACARAYRAYFDPENHMSRPAAARDLSSLPTGPADPNAADEIALAHFELERRRDEREEQDLRLREKQLAVTQQTGRRLRGLPALASGAILVGLVVAGMLFALLLQDRAFRRRELTLAEVQVRLARQRLDADLITTALTANSPAERAANLRFLTEAGFVTPATAARLAPFAQRAEGLPRLGRPASASAQESAVQVVERPRPPGAAAPFPAPPSPPSSAAANRSERSRPPAVAAAAPPRQPTPAAAAEDDESGDPYARAQRTLQAHGYYSGPMDGRYDTNTKKAVAKFQRERGLSDDGLIGRKTLRAIRELARSGRPRQNPPGSNAR
jgi:hypothetical protein